METNNKEQLVDVTPKDIVGKPFKLLSDKSFEFIKTGFEWYKHGKGHPLIGKWENGVFKVYDNAKKSWEPANYNDYLFDYTFEKDGTKKVIKRNYFETKHTYVIEFKNDETFGNIYNPASKKKGSVTTKRARLLLPKSIFQMVTATLESEKARPGTNPLAQFYKLTAIGTGISTRYSMNFHSMDTSAQSVPAISVPSPAKSLLEMQFVNTQDGKSYMLSSILSALKEQKLSNDVAVEVLTTQFSVPRDKAETAVKLA